jgi:hypothetical protein
MCKSANMPLISSAATGVAAGISSFIFHPCVYHFRYVKSVIFMQVKCMRLEPTTPNGRYQCIIVKSRTLVIFFHRYLAQRFAISEKNMKKDWLLGRL